VLCASTAPEHEEGSVVSSINTNVAALTALQNLNKLNKSMSMVQNEISTGYRVSSASDNAAYWSIATTMRSDKSALGAVSDALGLGSATVDTAYAGMNQAIDLVSQIKTKLVAAQQPGVDKTKVQTEIHALQSELRSVSDSASFSGQNWLSTDSSNASFNANMDIVASFTRSGTTISVGTIQFDLNSSIIFDSAGASSTLTGSATVAANTGGILDGTRTGANATSFSIASIDISALTDSAADKAKMADYIDGADSAVTEMTSAATQLGAVKTRIGTQKDFVTALMGAIDTGVSTLVDADMNQASTQYQALQVQQQLGVQALSIANSQAQSILSLFKGG
jgi:flagellin